MTDVPSRVKELVETFDEHLETYRSQQYNETQLRREFIDPFFIQLGWDVTNKAGYAQAYKDVIHEDAIKIGGATKAPDYCFRIGGVRKFFLEAKKPSVDIKGDPHPAYQLRRYAWSAKLPLSILTDFEEFAVYDCQTKPKQNDSASNARIMYFTYKEYVEKWEEIEKIFGRESILKGSFDKFAATTKGKRGTGTVDVEFLKEIESWRNMLARVIALRNTSLSVNEINFIVQRTIDRILFLRMCEDRSIEDYGQLLALSNGSHTYNRLFDIFNKADAKYNSGLFHFTKEKGRENPDELTPSVLIDDKELKWILHSLYYPQSPYEFSVLPAEILGNVYEQFLGKVIRLTSAHQAKIEDKPEVKKAGGVYYTPSYIVDYIVKNTVGKLCEGKTPRQVMKLKILDPACGSGSFLLGAYTFLLDFHRDWYVNNQPQKHTKKIYQGKAGQWFLTISEKKKILLNNIYGVDIDSQAVEVTKLSLLLKVLEGESQETLDNQYRLFHERALPDLANNIKCGNSLIGPDFFDSVIPSSSHVIPSSSPVIPSTPVPSGAEGAEESINKSHCEEAEGRHGNLEDLHDKINPFDWQAEFPQIFTGKNPGFDAVIGNPPYVRIQGLIDTQPQSVPYFSKHYNAASKGNYDIYVVFVEKGLKLLNKKGSLGFILPHKFFNAKYGQPLRKLISKGKHLSHIVHFGQQQVFAGATTYTCLLFLNKSPMNTCDLAEITDLYEWQTSGLSTKAIIRNQKVTSAEWSFHSISSAVLSERLDAISTKLGDIVHTFVGTQTSADTIFVLRDCRLTKNFVVGTCRVTREQVKIERNIAKPFLKGKQIRRYNPITPTDYLICPYLIGENSSELMSETKLSKNYPLAYAYLKSHKSTLEAREKGKFRGSKWFAFGYPKSMTLFQHKKIVVPDYNNVPSFTLDNQGCFYKTGYGIIPLPSTQESSLYILGLLNTRLLFHYLIHIGTSLRGGYVRFWTQFIERLPIRRIDFDNPDEKSIHDKIVQLVERMLDLHKKLAAAKVPVEKTKIQRQIDATDRQIDNIVYKLYDLTEEEIKIVEGR
jgi:hypothetical protein